MDPDALWTGFITVVKGAVQGTVTTVHAVLCIHNHSQGLHWCDPLYMLKLTSFDKSISDEALLIPKHMVKFPVWSFFQREQNTISKRLINIYVYVIRYNKHLIFC